MDDGEYTDVLPEAAFLAALSTDLFLSPACAAGEHAECWQVDSFRGRPCCCPDCDHVDLRGAPPPATLPLLHLADDGHQKPGYTYHKGQGLGVRTDLYRALNRVLELHVHELRRPYLTYRLAVAAALVYAPRRGA
ncbi:hypothetical protein ACLGIH_20290 [Streptomyces sp. HMX87]|uniref:hypothetical protein n=1 Tax=Streptomyces sp. HMX87 TaxID=3390849 RepID=UPI003A8AE13C